MSAFLHIPLPSLIILSFVAIQSELSVIKYIITNKQDNFSKKVCRNGAKGKLNDSLIQERQTDGLKLCMVYGNIKKNLFAVKPPVLYFCTVLQ
jgi:hypothetical protein